MEHQFREDDDQNEDAFGQTEPQPTQTTQTDELSQKSQYHAVVVQSGAVNVISRPHKNKLVKELETLGDFTLVSIFKGKMVPTREKTTLELM